MKPIFLDTYYFLALLNARDEWHLRAKQFSQSFREPLLTTSWILTELADGLSRSTHRHYFSRVLRDLKSNPQIKIIPPNQEWFDLGVELYETRPDKDWSLTDCISFVVMGKFGATDSLTADHHFEQAGFNILLKPI
jgi:predicted nucleic acid-binding protein